MWNVILVCKQLISLNWFNFLCRQYGEKDAGEVGHVPPGWDQWNALVSPIF